MKQTLILPVLLLQSTQLALHQHPHAEFHLLAGFLVASQPQLRKLGKRTKGNCSPRALCWGHHRNAEREGNLTLSNGAQEKGHRWYLHGISLFQIIEHGRELSEIVFMIISLCTVS